MGCSVRILSNVEPRQVDDLKNDRAQTIDELISELEDSVYDYWKCSIEYFKSWQPDTSADSEELILGCERPDALLAEVENWNQRIADYAIAQLEALENRAMEETGDSYRISELIHKHMVDGIFHEPSYPASVYSTRKSLAALTDYFDYGNDRLVHVQGDIEVSKHGTMVSKELLEHVKSHPEEYFIVELCYD